MKKHKVKTLNSSRSDRGAALVEGVLSICLVTAATVIALSFLTSYGMVLFYKGKIAFVANQIAAECAQEPNLEDATIVDFTKEILQSMDLPVSKLEVKKENLTIFGRAAIKITITNQNMPLFHKLDFLPMNTLVTDSATAILAPSPAYADAYLWSPRTKFGNYVIPLVKCPGSGPNFSDMTVIQN